MLELINFGCVWANGDTDLLNRFFVRSGLTYYVLFILDSPPIVALYFIVTAVELIYAFFIIGCRCLGKTGRDA